MMESAILSAVLTLLGGLFVFAAKFIAKKLDLITTTAASVDVSLKSIATQLSLITDRLNRHEDALNHVNTRVDGILMDK